MNYKYKEEQLAVVNFIKTSKQPFSKENLKQLAASLPSSEIDKVVCWFLDLGSVKQIDIDEWEYVNG